MHGNSNIKKETNLLQSVQTAHYNPRTLMCRYQNTPVYVLSVGAIFGPWIRNPVMPTSTFSS